MTPLPHTPEQLLETLFTLFPQYRAAYSGPIHDFAPTYHSVLIGFSQFFQTDTYSETQLCQFGDLINQAIAQEGLLKNAFETCLLEHLHQIKAWHALRSHLSQLARTKCHA